LLDGKYQTYFKKGEELYLFSNSQWIKEDINSFLIYQDETIKVFLSGKRTFFMKGKQ
jgi:hypothetical protein